MCDPFWGQVRLPIDLDNQPQFNTKEINRIRRDRMLASKLLTENLAISKPLPDNQNIIASHTPLRFREIDILF